MVHVLLVSGWQTVNIGDVAHTPGALEAFRRYAPDARITLWAYNIDDGVRRLLARYFADVVVIEEKPGEGEPGPELAAAFADADILVHGSGPALVARAAVRQWQQRTGKPYGFFGVTVDPLQPQVTTLGRAATMIESISGDLLTPDDRSVLGAAAFVFCRDSLTERFLQTQGIDVPELRFGPDATVLFDNVDDDHGQAVLDAYDLHRGGFLCAVPRLRFTPYYRLRGLEPTAVDLRRDAYNAGYLTSDLEALRQGIITWIRTTGEPALIVPEMSYAMQLAEDELAGTFPSDVADRVHILPRFWDLTEAAAVYRRAGAVLSMECHSPLIALGAGVPAIYLRQPTDTIKGQMYNDLGLGDRLVEIGPDAGVEVGQLLIKITDDRPAAVDLALQARSTARDLLRQMVQSTVNAVTTSQ